MGPLERRGEMALSARDPQQQGELVLAGAGHDQRIREEAAEPRCETAQAIIAGLPAEALVDRP